MGNHENCVRMSIDAGCSLTITDQLNQTPLDSAIKIFGSKHRVVKLLRGQNVPPLKPNTKSALKIDNIRAAALDGSLMNYFDVHDVEFSVVAKLIAYQEISTIMENILQILWFGGDVESRTP